jgi:hypothetical protein
MAEGHKPGAKAPASGIYRPTTGGTEIALSKGNRFPPIKAGGTLVAKHLIQKKSK